jgi:hypothetical protein
VVIGVKWHGVLLLMHCAQRSEIGSHRIFFFLQVSQAYSVNSMTAYAVRSEGTDSSNKSLHALLALPIRIQAERLRHYVESRLGFRNQRRLGVAREVQRYIIVERSNSEVPLNNAKCL